MTLLFSQTGATTLMVNISCTVVKQKLFDEGDSYAQLTKMCKIAGMTNWEIFIAFLFNFLAYDLTVIWFSSWLQFESAI